MNLSCPLVSVCIPTYNRQEDIIQLLRALQTQYFKAFEIVVVEGGDIEKTKMVKEWFKDTLFIRLFAQKKRGLVNARNEAWKKARGKIVAFTDDDVQPSSNWLKELATTFSTVNDIGGIGGPSIIPKELIFRRDLASWLLSKNSIIKKMVKTLHFKIFLENEPFVINHFFGTGAFSIGSMMPKIIGKLDSLLEVDYLDASNMCFSKNILEKVKGFDRDFAGVGDYSEMDLCFRVKRHGYKLLFNPQAIVYHYPSEKGVFEMRRDTYYRSRNLLLFYNKYFRLHFRFILYLFFLCSYYVYKALSTKNKSWLGGIKGIYENWRRK